MCEDIYTPTPNVNISTQLLKKSSSEKRWHKPKRRRSAVYSWYICTQYLFFFLSLSVSLSLYVWLSHGVWKERWSLFKFVVPGRHPFLFAKKAETWEWTPDPESSPTCWSDPLPVLQTVRLFSAPHCLHWAFVNQPTNPTNQPIQNIKKSHPSMCWNFRRQHVLRIAAKQFALGAVKVGTTESICFASRSIFVSLVMVDQDHFLLNQKSKRIEDGKVDWCSNLVSGNLWNPDDLCW